MPIYVSLLSDEELSDLYQRVNAELQKRQRVFFGKSLEEVELTETKPKEVDAAETVVIEETQEIKDTPDVV